MSAPYRRPRTTTELASRALELALIQDARRRAEEAQRVPPPMAKPPPVWGNRAQRRAALARADVKAMAEAAQLAREAKERRLNSEFEPLSHIRPREGVSHLPGELAMSSNTPPSKPTPPTQPRQPDKPQDDNHDGKTDKS